MLCIHSSSPRLSPTHVSPPIITILLLFASPMVGVDALLYSSRLVSRPFPSLYAGRVVIAKVTPQKPLLPACAPPPSIDGLGSTAHGSPAYHTPTPTPHPYIQPSDFPPPRRHGRISALSVHLDQNLFFSIARKTEKKIKCNKMIDQAR